MPSITRGVTVSANVSRSGNVGTWQFPTQLPLNSAPDAPLFDPTGSSLGYSTYLAATGFDFSDIPDGSTINGIVVDWYLFCDWGTGNYSDESVYLTFDAATPSGSNKAGIGTLPTFATAFTYGGAVDTWGTGPTTAAIKDPDFGSLLALSSDSGVGYARAKYCEITVYYTEAADPLPCGGVPPTKQFGAYGDLIAMLKNTSGQKIGSQMLTIADGSPFTGSVTVYVTGDAGTQAAGSVGSGACTHEGNGYHTYAPSQAETNYDLIAFTFVGSGAYNQTVQVATQSAGGSAPTVEEIGDELETRSLTVGTIETDAIDANAIKADAVTKIQTGLADAIADEVETRTVSANVVEINGNADAAERLENGTMAIAVCVVGDGSTTTSIVPTSIDPVLSALNQVKDQAVCFAADTTTAALRNHKTPILASDSDGTLQVKAMPAVPVNGDKFTIQ